MAFNLTQTYAGDAASGYISKAFFENRAVTDDLVSLLTNIKHKRVVNKLTSGPLIQADQNGGTCDFNASGDITIEESVLDPTPVRVNQEVCIYDLESAWEAENMRAGANNSGLATLQEFILNHYTAKTAEELDDLIWAGDTATDEFDGFNKIVGNSGGTNDITAGTLSSGNIIGELGKVYDAIPARVLRSQDVRIFIPYGVEQFYKRALASSGNDNFLLTQDQTLNYLGIPLEPVGLPDNTMIAGARSNMFLGTDLTSDMNEVSVIDLRETTGDDKIRFKMRFRAGVQIGFPSEIVHYV